LTVGRNLRASRRYLRLSQSVVADVLGTTRQAVAAFEKDQRAPNLTQLAGLANLYRLTLDELVGVQRSAIAPQVAPTILPRLNASAELGDDDRRELIAFKSYLHRRPDRSTVQFEQSKLEPVTAVVRRLLKASGFEDATPVPVFALIAQFGVEIRFTALDSLAGALLLGDGHPTGVLVNSDQPFERQRFSAAHELGHLLLGHEPMSGSFLSFLGRRFEPEELDADAFAGELLIPTHLLTEKVGDFAGRPIDESVYLLARTFAVSFQAMTLRLAKLGALRPDQQRKLDTVKPSEVAKRLASTEVAKTPFRSAWVATAAASLQDDWHESAGPDTVRMLQESAYLYYLTQVPEGNAADSAGGVYEQVAKWVAEKYPIVST
jgi:Zn-dependent peptidase ImmA (M78 family)/transcriptional regulator with XRE-family HTH domain